MEYVRKDFDVVQDNKLTDVKKGDGL